MQLKKHTLYNTGTEFSSYLPTFGPACLGPMKRSWRRLLNERKKKSHSKGTLAKLDFPLLLKGLLNDIKPGNLISGFRGTRISPLDNKEEVLKRTETSQDQLNESAEQLLGGSVVRVLQEKPLTSAP